MTSGFRNGALSISRLFVVICTLVASACAISQTEIQPIPQSQTQDQTQAQTAFQSQGQGQGIIYIYRPAKFRGSAKRTRVAIDGAFVGEVANAGHLVRGLNPGKHIIGVSPYTEWFETTPRNAPLEVSVEAGRSQYVRQAPGTVFLVSEVTYELVPESVALQEMPSLRAFDYASAYFATSAKAKWVEAAKSDRFTTFIDLATVQVNGDMYQVQALQDANEPDKDGVHSMLGLWEHDCKEERARNLARAYFSGPMLTGNVLASSSKPANWDKFPIGSTGERMLKLVCPK